jgi:hypothetical protein
MYNLYDDAPPFCGGDNMNNNTFIIPLTSTPHQHILTHQFNHLNTTTNNSSKRKRDDDFYVEVPTWFNNNNNTNNNNNSNLDLNHDKIERQMSYGSGETDVSSDTVF